ncbi:pyruvate carboxylase subunit B [Helicobacter enhydrae]|uniref:Pyruvate carboxylase subunit B n=1 Tax=Helicobacter enhydrae TaxID=222136 RepID=A0A1B1U725_9HELI|nr:pyruvate carboxylase subunit B [Helicobacter enhydrae]ANV98597.1 pyruvate carboxylase subunit B [Helicobacter enhydrae]
MRKIKITENSLRDGVQSLLATRVQTQDMIEVARIFEEIGFHSVEVWGGATYDACLRFLNEDPFERLKVFKEIFKTTPLQMLLRGQNLVGYKHYSDEIVKEFIKLSAQGGVDIFRIFDALNDVRNVQTSVEAVLKNGKHPQGAICYTTSPAHKLEDFLKYARELVAVGCQSLAIKDMAGLLRPYDAYELVKMIKGELGVELSVHIHFTTGFAFGSLLKAIEAGADVVDLSNSALSCGTSHSSTQAMVATLQGTQWDSGLSLEKMEVASKILREVRKKYQAFESEFNQIDTEILATQIPGGMISNLASQLKEQNALDRMEEVAQEIIKVRRDFGYIPLVTPTSQIVGTQAVLNVLQGERYKTLSLESKNLILGHYGRTPIEIDSQLVQRVHSEEAAKSSDVLENEQKSLEQICQESQEFARSATDVISYALFGDIAKRFLQNEVSAPNLETQENLAIQNCFEVLCDGKKRKVEIVSIHNQESGANILVSIDGKERSLDISVIQEAQTTTEAQQKNAIYTPMAGNVVKCLVDVGQRVASGEVVAVIEAMKMENEIVSPKDCIIKEVCVQVGQTLSSGQKMFVLEEE